MTRVVPEKGQSQSHAIGRHSAPAGFPQQISVNQQSALAPRRQQHRNDLFPRTLPTGPVPKQSGQRCHGLA